MLALILKTLIHYWRTSLTLAVAVAVAVAVLTGSLLLGASMRASLRTLAVDRLGHVDQALFADSFFREKLVDDIPRAVALIVLNGSMVHAESGARAPRLHVIGCRGGFWRLDPAHPSLAFNARGLAGDEVLLNEALARKLHAAVGDEVLLRVAQPSAVSMDSWLGRREQNVVTLRLRVVRILPLAGLGQFSRTLTQYQPENAYLSLDALARRLKLTGQVNAMLTPEGAPEPQRALAQKFNLEDLGLRLKPMAGGAISLETAHLFFSPYLELAVRRAAEAHGLTCRPTLAYLANDLRVGGRSIPYSIVTALDDAALGEGQIALNEWAARDLRAQPGQRVTLTYFKTNPDGGLSETSASLTLARILPMTAPLVSRDLTPDFPGIGDADQISRWHPPFPLDLRRIRPVDEAYWKQYRTTPKAFVALKTGTRLWTGRFGQTTSFRLSGAAPGVVRQVLHNAIDPARAGLAFEPLRAQSLAASRGSSDFGGLFLGFSFFLLLAAAMLIRLLEALAIESRARQVGLFGAVGFSPGAVRRLLLAEGALIALPGGILGAAGGVLYAALLMHGLRSWWIGSIGVPFLRLTLDPASLILGPLIGWLVAMIAIASATRQLTRVSPRALLAGRLTLARDARAGTKKSLMTAIFFTAAGLLLPLAAARAAADTRASLFFGAGACLLVAALAFFRAWLRHEPAGAGRRLTLTRLGLSGARRQPGRSLLIAGLMACATLIIVATGAYRQAVQPSRDKASGTGGLALIGEATLPLGAVPGLPLIARQDVYAFRLRPGEDASCLNLYQARRPRLLGVPEAFIERGGFVFADSLAGDAATRQNPWLLLRQPLADGATAVIGDENTVLWLLHSGLGRDWTMDGVRYRFVGLLKGSIFQSELLIGQENFERLFPAIGGWSFFLLDAPPEHTRALASSLEARYDEDGLEVTPTAERLGRLLAVENTYLSAFQSLGGLGLLLGTLGLALVLLRNLLERRAELAYLRAIGLRESSLLRLTVAENMLLLLMGLAIGTLSALLALAPSLLSGSLQPPWASLALILCATLLVGLAAMTLGAWIVLRAPALETLKNSC